MQRVSHHSVNSQKRLPVRRTVSICVNLSFLYALRFLRRVPLDHRAFQIQNQIPCAYSSISRINKLKSW